MKTIICGKGRLGQLIAERLIEKGMVFSHARVDAVRGLTQNEQVIAGAIDTLILCFVPKHTEGKSGWQDLLSGVLQQVESGTLKIQRVLFISSTAVYESVKKGFVNTRTPVKDVSIRSQGLLDAEKIVQQLSSSSVIFRLTGLVGAGYNKYDPLTYSYEKPRQAVDIRAVSVDVLHWFLQEQTGHRIEALTNGLVYWKGKALDPARDHQKIKTLAAKHRLLVPSIISI